MLAKTNAELRQYLVSKILLDLPPLPHVKKEESFAHTEKEAKNMKNLISKSDNLMKVFQSKVFEYF